MAHNDMTPEEEQRMLADLDELAKIKPNYFAGAFTGMTFAWMYGFLANKPAKGNRLKYAAYGAGVYMLAQFAGHALLKKTDAWAHQHPFPRVPAPSTPVVTKGHFAGAPRPLYHAGAALLPSRYHVGAPPPNRDYSFTRRPGFNGKDY
jgi:hypothetical protein